MNSAQFHIGVSPKNEKISQDRILVVKVVILRRTVKISYETPPSRKLKLAIIH